MLIKECTLDLSSNTEQKIMLHRYDSGVVLNVTVNYNNLPHDLTDKIVTIQD